MSKIKTILSIIFIFTIWGCVSSAYPILLWWSRECVLYLIIIIKPEVWVINQCLGLGHETMVCAVCLTMFLCSYYLRLNSYTRSIVSRGICGSIVLLAVINPTQWAIRQNLMLLITLVHYIPAQPGKNRAHAFYSVSCVCLARRGNSYAWVCTFYIQILIAKHHSIGTEEWYVS